MVPYHTQSAQRYKLYPTAAAVGNTIYVRPHMTDRKQHVESTTLQPCCTAAAVRDTIYVRLACPRYAAASCLCRACHDLPPHHTARFCCAAALGARVHRCGNIGTFVIVTI